MYCRNTFRILRTRRVAEMHAGFAVGAGNLLGCPARQKLQLVDAVIRQLESKAKKTAV